MEEDDYRNELDRDELLCGTRVRKERASSPSIFISKTFEILDVPLFLFRMKSTKTLSDGTKMAHLL